LNWKSLPRRYWDSLSFLGLVVAALFFSASLSPSLLPRNYIVQGILSGIALSTGYGIGVFLVWFWGYLELPKPRNKMKNAAKLATTTAVFIYAFLFLRRATVWQNSIRELMEMEPLETAYPWRIALIAVVFGTLLIAGARVLGYCYDWVHFKVSHVLPRRISLVLSSIIVGTLLLFIVNGILAKQALNAADSLSLRFDQKTEEGETPPADPLASGSADSLIPWDSIGRQGKNFIERGPTQAQLAKFSGRAALRPLRVYVGLGAKETPEERAQLALAELQRVGAFDRSLLVVATPTGTGWLDPAAVDTLEYLHHGDTAIVSMQYSYLPSWITILVDPKRSIDSAKILFDEIYGHWKSLPPASRPKLYLHGLSLGSLGSEICADLFTLFEDPIDGGLWSGPPFPSTRWSAATRGRNPDSPAWLPTFRDGAMLRFTGQQNSLDNATQPWGPMRFVYIQHASDPMVFFSPDLLFEKPAWLKGSRGPDVSPFLDWYPIITFLQIAFDLPMATSVPLGYGHNYAPKDYINGWIAVTDPQPWTDEDTLRLKQMFVE